MGIHNTSEPQEKGGHRGRGLRQVSEMVANPILGSWEAGGTSSANTIHSSDQICLCQSAEINTNKPEDFWNCCLCLIVPANLRFQNDLHQYLTLINKNLQGCVKRSQNLD